MPDRDIKVFMASPGDLTEERAAFRDQIRILNQGFGEGAGVNFVPLGWEDVPPTTGNRPQALINELIDSCELIFVAFYERWGQASPDAAPYSSYTEEEFFRAYNRQNKTGNPSIVVLFKEVSLELEATPSADFEKVQTFRGNLAESNDAIYGSFKDAGSFRGKIDDLCRRFAKGHFPKPNSLDRSVRLPEHLMEMLDAEKRKADEKSKRLDDAVARIEFLELDSAKQAVEDAEEGRVQLARMRFSKLLEHTQSLAVLNSAGEFFFRLGEFDIAKSCVDRAFALSTGNRESLLEGHTYLLSSSIAAETGRNAEALEYAVTAKEIFGTSGETVLFAKAISHVAIAKRNCGDFKAAIDGHRQARDIMKKAGDFASLAREQNNLGIVLLQQGKLDDAQCCFEQAMELYEKFPSREGEADVGSNLANVFLECGENALAEKMLRGSLAIEKYLGRRAKAAADYGNLGIIRQREGDYASAKSLYTQALRENQFSGRSEGVALQLINLGVVARLEHDFSAAETYFVRSLELCRKINLAVGIAVALGNLAELLIVDFRGRLDEGSGYLEQAVEENRRLGRRRRLAELAFLLGRVLLDKGNFAGAKLALAESYDCFSAVQSSTADEVKELLAQIDLR
ncbi:MAG: tetratricopeptide repeat protein [Pseudomonadota bacterium]